MACSKFQGEGREYSADYDAFYQAIESYGIKALIREAISRGILSDLERSEIERQKTRHLMRDCLIKSILYRGTREQQRFARFVHEFSRRAYEQTCKQLAGFQQHVSNITKSSIESDAGCVHAGKELPQLSQDSSHSSAGSASPMELDIKPPVESNTQDLVQGLSDDLGYFSISGSGSLSNDPVYAPGSSTSYTSTSFMENELKKLQKTRGHRFQRFVSSKQQHSQVPAVFNFPSASSQIAPNTVNYFVTKNVFNISNACVNTDSDSHGTEYPGPVTTLHSCAKLSGRYSPVQSTQPQEKKWESEWSQCLKEHHCRIIEYLDVNTLLPHLWEKGLLTPNERDTLDSMCMTPREKARYLLRILPGKGKHGFKLFLECLRDEKYHLGHEDLVKCLNYSSQNL